MVRVHAGEVCESVWPGGTVDPDAIEWTWNGRLRSTAGRFRAHPDDRPPEVELAWGYYREHGLAELLSTVRHELIHAWQYFHPDGGRVGHGPTFTQWVEDLDTSRHCRRW